ncbi:transmembrane protein 256 homolog isoform X2 [Gordionus sp. m RMFG-2023]|uniref:transmembrane protein 256 homolog isoform X2 n=1 Tax=Gordionus sp. m RMFG-2023 TaxID=3053472 RepID=UPI0031FC90CA
MKNMSVNHIDSFDQLLKKITYHASTSVLEKEKNIFIFNQTQKFFLGLGSLSAASAYFLAAYGKHVIEEKNISTKSKQVYQTAKQFHFISSIALMLVPLSKKPLLERLSIGRRCY